MGMALEGRVGVDWCPSVVPCPLPSGVLVLLTPSPSTPLEVDAPVGRRLFEAVAVLAGRAPADEQLTLDTSVVEALDYLLEVGVLRRVQSTPGELELWDRQLRWFAQRDLCPVGAQTTLMDTSALVVGLGGLGGAVAEALLRAGIGCLTGVDCDRVERENLPRQTLYEVRDVGRAKVIAAQQRLLAVAPPAASVSVMEQRLTAESDVRALLEAVDPGVVVLAADTPALALLRWFGKVCEERGVPLITAGQHMPLVYVGPFVVPGRTLCVACALGTPLDDELATLVDAWDVPLPGFGPADLLAASVLTSEVIAWLTGTHAPASLGARLEIDVTSFAPRVAQGAPACERCIRAFAQEAA